MAKITIQFPQIVIGSKEIEVTNEQADDLILHNIDPDKFIWDNMTELEQSWTFGQQMIETFLDNGACKIARLNTPSV